MSTPVQIVIVGGVAGGMSAATRARRCNESANIVVLEKTGHISFANCGLPYYLDGRISSQDKLLLTTPRSVASRYRIDARVGHEVLSIDRTARTLQVRDLTTQQTYSLPYDKLILAPGANPIVPPIANVTAPNVFLMRNVEDTLRIKSFMDAAKPQRAVIIGAGYIGLEMADTLRHAGLNIAIVEKAPQPMPLLDPDMVQPIADELRASGIDLTTGDGLLELRTNDTGHVRQVLTESGRILEADLVVMSIGVRPNVAIAQAAGIELGATGAIRVDQFQRTNDPNIYAVGDAAEVIHSVTGKAVRIPLAGSANRAGRNAGEHAACGTSAPAGAVLGTSIVQVFNVAAGLTGLSESAARAAGFDADSALILPNDHAGYYPGAQQMRLKLIYDKATGRVLGAQAVGKAGIDKRLDVIATAIHFKGTIDDLSQLDLAYSPQYGSAKDPIHYAAFVAQNQRSGLTPAISPKHELKDYFLLDVRSGAEYSRGALPNATNIPLDELRQRLGELPRERRIAVNCQVGLRGHIATRILRQNGFDAVNLKGGYAVAGSMK